MTPTAADFLRDILTALGGISFELAPRQTVEIGYGLERTMVVVIRGEWLAMTQHADARWIVTGGGLLGCDIVQRLEAATAARLISLSK